MLSKNLTKLGYLGRTNTQNTNIPFYDEGTPSLDLNFAENKNLVDNVSSNNLVTFTRASSGTFVNSAGVLQTAVTNEPRFDHNPTTGESLGLLVEEQRTNLLLNSGTLSTQSATVTAVAHTLHFTGTGTITLTGVSTAGPLVGTGTGEANRVSLTFTPTAGSLTLTVSGTVTNAQLEAGAFRTSYIPTVASTVTRSADVASITGTNFSSWYRQDEGTVYHQGRTPTAANFFSIDDGTTSNRITSFMADSVTPLYFVGAPATSVFLGSSTITAGSTFAQADAYKAADFAMSTNGGTVGTASSGSVPVVNKMIIGANTSGSAVVNGTIRRLTYWPTRLSNTMLQNITK